MYLEFFMYMHSCPQDEKYARQLQDEEEFVHVAAQKKERQQYQEYGENKNDIVRGYTMYYFTNVHTYMYTSAPAHMCYSCISVCGHQESLEIKHITSHNSL